MTDTRYAQVQAEIVAAAIARIYGEPEPEIAATDDAWRYVTGILIEFVSQMPNNNTVGAALNNGDYRRCAALACAVATGDDQGIAAVLAEAEAGRRTWHLIVAQAVSVAKGFRADTPEGLQELRCMVARLVAEEGQENQQ